MLMRGGGVWELVLGYGRYKRLGQGIASMELSKVVFEVSLFYLSSFWIFIFQINICLGGRHNNREKMKAREESK